MATIIGTLGNDNLPRLTDPSTVGDDIIYGFGGNDTINGGAGNDTIYGDTTGLNVAPTNDLIYGGDGNDFIDGQIGNDTINGGAGNDIINGGVGIDTMEGGLGNDIFYVDSTSDVVTDGVGAGTDTVDASANYSLSANVENLYLSGFAYYGYGNALNNYIVGNNINNYLWGAAGNDILNGGVGNDTMVGADGNDAYIVDSTNDVVIETLNVGTDNVYAYASYSLSANVENLFLYGNAYYGYGNELNNYMTGNAGNNYLWGAAGNDTMNGGAGNDTMVGADGNDIYYVDSTSDVIIEGLGAITDIVYASASYSLSANVENLYLSGSAYYGYGNALNNYIAGTSGNNVISGGAGIDTMAGGAGNDGYYVDSTSDVIYEGVGAGTDSVYAYASYTLGANVENLYMYGGAYYGYGNELNNYIAGNSGSNLIWGGAGNDTMAGGAGNDVYYVDSTSDVIIEGVGAGTDYVYAYASYTLGANVENLYMYGSAYYGYGNELNNIIAGNAGNNYLWGGAGNDTMTGGAGNDTIRGSVGSDVLTGSAGADYFNFYSPSEGIDTITDFSWVQGDKIALSSTGFANLKTAGGSLDVSEFGTRIIYNSSTGALFFDSDATGVATQVQFATLSPGLALSSSDFQVLA